MTGTEDSFYGVNRPGHITDHFFRSNSEVQNEWSFISTPPICFHGMHRQDIYHVFASLCTWFIYMVGDPSSRSDNTVSWEMLV